MYRFQIFLISCLSLPAIVLASPETLDGKHFSDTLARVDRVYVAGQPSPEGLGMASDMGIETIVSLRTPEEMKDSDEADQAARLGIDFVSIPSGGDEHPFSPDEVARFNEVMTTTEGDVLLHCKSGTRATHLYVAWLVDYQNVPLQEALKIGRQIQFGQTPLEGYLRGRIDYSLQESSLQEGEPN